MKTQNGAAMFLMSVILLSVSTMIAVFAANISRYQQASVGNASRNYQAFEAAQAGMEYAISYLQNNSSTVTASPSGGYITYTIGPVTLTNNASYTIVYTNPTASNYSLLNISVTGTSDDGTSTRTVKQQVQSGCLLAKLPINSLNTLGPVKLKDDAVITNIVNNKNIKSALNVAITINGHTVTDSGTSSTSSIIKSDVIQNDSSLSSMTENDYLASYFGTSNLNSIKSQSTYNYTAGSGVTDYSSTLNGVTGASIYIDATGGKARIRQDTVIGSPSNPVLLVVRGKLRIAGNAIIYGFVMVIDNDDDLDAEDADGEGSLTGNAQIIGGLSTTDRVKVTRTSILKYNQSILNNLRNSNATKYFAKVPGSWRDF